MTWTFGEAEIILFLQSAVAVVVALLPERLYGGSTEKLSYTMSIMACLSFVLIVIPCLFALEWHHLRHHRLLLQSSSPIILWLYTANASLGCILQMSALVVHCKCQPWLYSAKCHSWLYSAKCHSWKRIGLYVLSWNRISYSFEWHSLDLMIRMHLVCYFPFLNRRRLRKRKTSLFQLLRELWRREDDDARRRSFESEDWNVWTERMNVKAIEKVFPVLTNCTTFLPTSNKSF